MLPPIYGSHSGEAVTRAGLTGCYLCSKYRAALQEANDNLTRKYAHAAKLKARNTALRQEIERLQFELAKFHHMPTCDGVELISQSGEVGATGQVQMQMSPNTQQEIMGFSDQDAGWTTSIGFGSDATMDQVAKIDSSLGSFMERPLEVASYDWVVGQPLLETLNPWKVYFDNPLVQKKIDNFKLARCRLHVKAVISGTGFHYGRVIAAYNPVPGGDQVTVDRNFIEQDLVALSQKPHIFLNPTTNQGGEMCLPFFYRKNYVDLTRFEFDDLGQIDFKSFGNLQTVNASSDSVVITVYAWTEDLSLTMPTETLVSQSGTMDEFGMGIVSKPASAVAKAAGALERVPIIGVYARATEMVANAVSGIAQLFGYSRPPIVSDIQLYKPMPQGNLANVDAPDATVPLSMDSKAELTIDSRTVGLDGVDQMSIKSIVTRESYLTSFQWASTDNPAGLLWNCRVNPSLYSEFGTEFHMTPMCLMANMFKYWKGSIKYRFQVVCSDFHKGRLVLSFDPNASSTGINYNAKYNRVIDLAKDRDFEIICGWGQAEPFLEVFQPSSGAVIYADDTVLTDQTSTERWNGTIQLSVVNRLVSPEGGAPVRVNVYVSMCDDYKFGEPSADFCNAFTYFNPSTQPPVLTSQSGEMSSDTSAVAINEARPMEDKPTDPISIMNIADTAPAVDHTYDVFFGESPQSLRDLFKRYILTRVWSIRQSETNDIWTLRNKDLPLQYGRDPEGPDTVDDINFFTINRQGPLQKFMPCFAGWRGGLRRKFYFSGGCFDKTSPNINRFGFLNETPSLRVSDTINEITDEGRTRQLTTSFAPRAWNGAASTLVEQNRALEVQLPYYFNDRFLSPRIVKASELACGSHLLYMELPPDDVVADSLGSVQEHVSTGEDFSLFFWTGVPIMWRDII